MKLHFTSSYHPEGDAQTECVNQTLEQYLQVYCNYQQDNWSDLQPLAAFTYNNALNVTTGLTPFYTNKGYHPSITIHPEYDITSTRAWDFAVNLDNLHQQFHSHISDLQKWYSVSADKCHTISLDIKIGDKVFVKSDNICTTWPSNPLLYISWLLSWLWERLMRSSCLCCATLFDWLKSVFNTKNISIPCCMSFWELWSSFLILSSCTMRVCRPSEAIYNELSMSLFLLSMYLFYHLTPSTMLSSCSQLNSDHLIGSITGPWALKAWAHVYRVLVFPRDSPGQTASPQCLIWVWGSAIFQWQPSPVSMGPGISIGATDHHSVCLPNLIMLVDVWSGTVRATLECCRYCTITQADREENQSMNNQQKYNKGDLTWQRGKPKEKFKVSPLLVSPYYTMPDYDQDHYSVCTDPALCGPLTKPGCRYELFHIYGNSRSESGIELWLESRVEFGNRSGAEFQLEKRSRAEFWPRGGVESGTAEVWDGASPDRDSLVPWQDKDT